MPIGPDVIAERLLAQGLGEVRDGDAVAVVGRLLAVQGQDPRGFRLAVRARSESLSAADVERALGADRTLLVTWLNRGTLHLVRSEDYPWLQALTVPPLRTGIERRLGQEGVGEAEAERGVEGIEAALADEGQLTRPQLRERLDAAGVRTEGQALVHLLALASARGLIVRGPVVGKQHAFVLVRDWLGETPAIDRDVALAELARRYLVGHGPAADRDLAKWAGLPLRDARAGLTAIAAELEQLDGGLVRLARQPTAPGDFPPPRLLGPFDPILLGWASRAPLLASHPEDLVVNGGHFRPFALADGRVVAGWKLVRAGVVVEPFESLSARVASALELDAADVVRFLAAV